MLRREDDQLLKGQGRFIADTVPSNATTMVVLRSPIAFGTISGLDLDEAREMPGVLDILTASDLQALGVKPLASAAGTTNQDGSASKPRPRPILADRTVRYAGEPVAAIIAETEAQALDALDVITLDIEEKDAAADVERAAEPGAPQIWPDAPLNRAFDYGIGNKAETEQALTDAAHIFELTVRHPRIIIAPIETRGCVGQFDESSGRYTLNTGSQGVVSLRNAMANSLGEPPSNVRVITEHVGGSFAMKIWPYPEQALTLVAAKRVGRPVAWFSSRTEGMPTDIMGRGRVDRAILALDAELNFTAFKIEALTDMGAYLGHVSANTSTMGAVRIFSQCYHIPNQFYRAEGIYTNAVSTDAYRGAGKPESAATLERLIDRASYELGVDRVELRKQNLLQPSQIPWDTPMGERYTSGDFPEALEAALAAADWAGLAERKRESAAKGLLRGAGLGVHIHGTGGSKEERSEVRALPDGSVLVRTGTQDSGQGHRDALALVASEALEIPVERIHVEQGDSDLLEKGGGTGGSNLMPIAANTVHRTSLHLIDQAKQAASHLLEAATIDIEYGAGEFKIAGTDRKTSLADIAAHWESVPAEAFEEEKAPACVAQLDFEGEAMTFPSGSYVVEVEVDPETGGVFIERFCGVDDLGRIFNELTARGQIHGGIGQAVGEIMMEGAVYDDYGQLLTGSFMDYALPRATDLPLIEHGWTSTPAPNSLIGAKGVGELSSIGAPGPLMNAVLDAIRPLGVEHIDMPLTPQKIWTAIQEAKTK